MDLDRDMTELGQLLTEAAGPARLRSATTDSTKLLTPGAWTRVNTIRHEHLDGSYVVDCTVHLVVPESEPKRAHKRLSELFNLLRPTLENVGWSGATLAFTGLVVPGSQTPLPALAIPVELHVTESED